MNAHKVCLECTNYFNLLLFFPENKMEDLPEQERKKNVVDALEIQYYEVQLELYEVKFEILS